MTDGFVHQRSQIDPCLDNSLHQVGAVCLEVVTLPEPANRRIHVPVGRPPRRGTRKSGTRLLGEGLPVAFHIRPDSADQPPARGETRGLARPFQSHIRLLITLGPILSPQAQSCPGSFSEKRLDLVIGDPSAPESRIEIALETAVEAIHELAHFGFQISPLPDLRFVL